MGSIQDSIVTKVEPSVSGTGAGIVSTMVSFFYNVQGNITDTGEISITGNSILALSQWKPAQISKVAAGRIKDKLAAKSAMLHWTDILAVFLVSETRFSVADNLPVRFKAGKRILDELEILMIVDEIAISNGTTDWNRIMRDKQKADPIEQYTEGGNSSTPFKPDSPYWNGGKAVFKYDTEAGVIIWSDGEILWIKTNKIYYARSEPIIYGYEGPIVEFKNGGRLNLSTLIWTNLANKQETTVKPIDDTPLNRIIQKVLTDTKTQLLILASLIILLFLKKRNAR